MVTITLKPVNSTGVQKAFDKTDVGKSYFEIHYAYSVSLYSV
jgi:hypothetical protein